MGIMDRINKVKDRLKKDGDKVADGVDTATDLADEHTGGKHTEHLDKVDDMADKLRTDDAVAADDGAGTAGADAAAPAADADGDDATG